MRSGRKVVSSNLVIYSKRVEEFPLARFGFVVSKAVGNAVVRNLVKRRLREICRTSLDSMQPANYVVRALPGASGISYQELRLELLASLEKISK